MGIVGAAVMAAGEQPAIARKDSSITKSSVFPVNKRGEGISSDIAPINEIDHSPNRDIH
jgi:hypothetical protein